MYKSIKLRSYRGIQKSPIAVFSLLAILGSSPSLAGEALYWDLVTLSGDGESIRNYSTCYLFEDLRTRILPLDGETTSTANYVDSLQAEIRSIGNYEGKEFYDVVQKYRLRNYPDPTHISYVKLLGFKYGQNEFCPFYSWIEQASRIISDDLESQIMEVNQHILIGHHLRVYRGYETDYFVLADGLPSSLRFNDLIQGTLDRQGLIEGQFIRMAIPDIAQFTFKVQLQYRSDANCCPSGKVYLFYFNIAGGELTIRDFIESSW